MKATFNGSVGLDI